MEGKRNNTGLLFFLAFVLAAVFFGGQIDYISAEYDENMPCVVIDAGHGGIDPGKISAEGVQEKEINLQIANKLKSELESQGIRVVMTRESDEGLYREETEGKKTEDMKNRCKIIEETAPVCTVSIHQNSFPDTSVYGSQVFYYHTSDDGRQLAGILQKQLNQDLGIAKPREEKENSTYYILKRSTSVTVLVECGFLSNPQEARQLASEDYQQRVAESICSGLLTWINGNCYNEIYEYEDI